METPFVFGRLAVAENYTDRSEEKQRLIQNFLGRINTILISPRRWGKSSLVLQASKMVLTENKELRFCFLDGYNIRTEEEFYQNLAVEVLRASSSRFEVLLDYAGKFLGQLLPVLSISPDSQNELALKLEWKAAKENPTDILNLAENIASEKGLKFIICIDEFQNISTFEDSLAFQKKLRSAWQKHQQTTYCLSGSKRHMMIGLFADTSMPFYKFGDLLFLEKIKREDWIPFIIRRFSDTGKNISEKEAALIADLAECHPYYVQQLAQLCWFRTQNDCSEEIIHEAHRSLIDQLSLLFQSKTDELSNTQIGFLKAVISGVEKLSSKESLDAFRIGTSANVVRIKQALISKEIIDVFHGNISIQDPMYRFWLKNDYFKIYS